MIEAPDHALLLVVSGPSGSGKSTLCHRLLDEFPRVTYSISCTTRSPRGDEVDGVAYHFLTEEDFRRRVKEGAFLEWAEVHGHLYGTLRSSVTEALAAGRDLLMDIDVQGAEQVRRAAAAAPVEDALHGALVDVFIAPPSMEVLEARLRGRAEDAPEVIARRLKKAQDEMALRWSYRYLVVNEERDRAYDALRSVVLAEHHRIERKGGSHAG
jgi:guanylate kinase